MSSSAQLQQFHETVVTLCTLKSIQQNLWINSQVLTNAFTCLNELTLLIVIISKYFHLSLQSLDRVNQKMGIRHLFTSRTIGFYQNTYHEQIKLNQDFHGFVENYWLAYKGPNTAKHQIDSSVPDDIRKCC